MLPSILTVAVASTPPPPVIETDTLGEYPLPSSPGRISMPFAGRLEEFVLPRTLFISNGPEIVASRTAPLPEPLLSVTVIAGGDAKPVPTWRINELVTPVERFAMAEAPEPAPLESFITTFGACPKSRPAEPRCIEVITPFSSTDTGPLVAPSPAEIITSGGVR